MQSEEINVSSPTAQDIANRLFSIAARVKELSQDTNMETEQLMILLRAILPSRPPTPPVFSPGVNVILTARARTIDPQAPDVLNEDHPPSPGDIDVKGTEDPLPFDGSPSDARPFIERVEAWFALLPYSYRLTRTWIIATCPNHHRSLPLRPGLAKCLGLST